jgi:hypothetical protein
LASPQAKLAPSTPKKSTIAAIVGKLADNNYNLARLQSNHFSDIAPGCISDPGRQWL